MPEQKKQNEEPQLSPEDYRRFVFERLAASWLYWSGAALSSLEKRVMTGAPGWRILCYRHIVDPEHLLYPISKLDFVRPETFRTQLHYLARNCTIIPLGELLLRLETNQTIPSRTVCLTFDGGFIDLYRHAVPLLRAFRFPASVFIPTSFIGSMNMFWNEKLAASLLVIKKARLAFPRFSFLSEEQQAVIDALTPRGEITMEAILALEGMFAVLKDEQKLSILSSVADQVEALGGLPLQRCFIDWDEARTMQRGGISFGSFGHSHKALPLMAEEELVDDLYQSIKTMQAEQIEPLPALSYPEALYNDDVRAVLARLGIKYSVALSRTENVLPIAGRAGLLSRTLMFEGTTYCKELFACRLWEASGLGFRF